jgi:hypothetical protein
MRLRKASSVDEPLTTLSSTPTPPTLDAIWSKKEEEKEDEVWTPFLSFLDSRYMLHRADTRDRDKR